MGEVDMTTPADVVAGVVAGAARVVPPGTERDCGEPLARSHGMDGIRELLSAVRDAGLAAGNFRGLLHIAIGRKITRPDGTTLSTGVTWRALAADLKNLRFDTELVREFGADPDALAARDRERFWYSAIALAKVDSAEAVADAEKLVPRLRPLGFIIGPPPSGSIPEPTPAKPKAEPKAKAKEEKPPKKKKK